MFRSRLPPFKNGRCTRFEIADLILSNLMESEVTWAIYIDDERTPKTGSYEWAVVRSVEDAKALIVERGCPTYISFDHDLGEDCATGFDFAKWLVESDLDGKITIPRDFLFNVHSANPAGAANIRGLMVGYLEFRKHK